MAKEYNHTETEPVKQAPVANYRKVEEHSINSYDQAKEMADNLFAPFGKADASGSRTCDVAKVRIRRQGGGFRVVLLKHLSTFKTAEPKKKEEVEPVKKNKQRQHRNDRKGKKRKQREHKAASSQ